MSDSKQSQAVEDVSLSKFRPRCQLKIQHSRPLRPKFPVIDAHNHLFGAVPAEQLIEVMDQAGVGLWLNVSGNVTMPLVDNTYTIARQDYGIFKRDYIERFPGRFAAFTMSEFAQWGCPLLFQNDFVKRCLDGLETDVAKGAAGLKITKELGLVFTDADGSIVRVDDERLYPIWERAGKLGVPVLIHVSDPTAFFEPVDAQNEHFQTLREFPGWSFYGSHFSKDELLAQRNRMIAAHPRTVFILPHVANRAEDLAAVGRLLDKHPNVVIDFSARIDEIGRQPYTARDFFIKYQDRILFGVQICPSRRRSIAHISSCCKPATNGSIIPIISADSASAPVGNSTAWTCPTTSCAKSTRKTPAA